MDVGQAAINAAVAEGQFLVVDPEQMKKGGVKIVAGGGAGGGFP